MRATAHARASPATNCSTMTRAQPERLPTHRFNFQASLERLRCGRVETAPGSRPSIFCRTAEASGTYNIRFEPRKVINCIGRGTSRGRERTHRRTSANAPSTRRQRHPAGSPTHHRRPTEAPKRPPQRRAGKTASLTGPSHTTPHHPIASAPPPTHLGDFLGGHTSRRTPQRTTGERVGMWANTQKMSMTVTLSRRRLERRALGPSLGTRCVLTGARRSRSNICICDSLKLWHWHWQTLGRSERWSRGDVHCIGQCYPVRVNEQTSARRHDACQRMIMSGRRVYAAGKRAHISIHLCFSFLIFVRAQVVPPVLAKGATQRRAIIIHRSLPHLTTDDNPVAVRRALDCRVARCIDCLVAQRGRI